MLTSDGELFFGDVLMALTAAAHGVDVTEIPQAVTQRLLRRAAAHRRKQLQASAGHEVGHRGGGGGAGLGAVVWAGGGGALRATATAAAAASADLALVPVNAILATLLLQRVARRWLERRRRQRCAAQA